MQTGPDLTTLQADFDAIIKGNNVFIAWDWGGNSAFLDMIRLEVDRGNGKGFQFLANDTTPGYLDGMPFPDAPTKWTYRAIYIVGDAQVGVWSKPVTVGDETLRPPAAMKHRLRKAVSRSPSHSTSTTASGSKASARANPTSFSSPPPTPPHNAKR